MPPLRKPAWLRIPLRTTPRYHAMNALLQDQQIHTICSSGQCPNRQHCWSHGTATFMILGDICTRACRFCATRTGRPLPVVEEEAQQVAQSVRTLGLRHCVLTSVDRDDLPDKGAAHWAAVIRAVRTACPEVVIEVLIPDYRGDALQTVLAARPDLVGHNMETVRRLTPSVRSKATYDNSLSVLQEIAHSGMVAKTGIMVGLGETDDEVMALMHDVYKRGCRRMTIGQYLQPTPQQLPIVAYIHPDTFALYKKEALAIGFISIESGPLVRSSYMAEASFKRATAFHKDE